MGWQGTDGGLVDFISGVDANGRAAAVSFATWTRSGSSAATATYSSYSAASKWGSGVPGTGATISYAFDPASHWTTTEQNAFVAGLHLWQAEANLTFVAAASTATAGITITRTSDGKAQGYVYGTGAAVGSATIGTATRGGVQIDPSGNGFGPIGQSFTAEGGYPWTTVVHEIGHALGLGHPGPYDGDAQTNQQISSIDSRAESVMSYFDADSSGYGYSWGYRGGYDAEPVTPMPLDIAAIQRLYGAPVSSPLNGVVFGFNSTIVGDIRPFFDFTVNTQPIVTLWSGSGGNTLDLTGFASASSGSLREGAGQINTSGLQGNIGIAAGTHIDTLLLGPGNDTFTGNDDGDVMIGGLGADRLGGGAGNDHLYGGGRTAVAGDGGDRIDGGAGSDYLQGNAGADTLIGGDGSDRIYGGADNDSIDGGSGNDTINGNLGNDRIDSGDGNDLVRGGKGNDTLVGGSGNDIVMGDAGDDHVNGGWGIDQLIGGDGADVFEFVGRDATYDKTWDAYHLDEIVDYASGTDHLHLDMGTPSSIVRIGAQASVQAAADWAEAHLTGLNDPTTTYSQVVVASVGGDTLLFFWGAAIGMEGVRIDGLDATRLTTADFV